MVDTLREVTPLLFQEIGRKFASVRRLGRAGLVIVVVIGIGAGTTALATAASSGGGWDVSWPQCVSAGGSEALPGSPALGIVGINDGRPFTTNPCLASELEWAGVAGSVYVNSDDPGPRTATIKGKVVQEKTEWPAVGKSAGPTGALTKCVLTGANGTTATPSCAYVYGWNAAKASYAKLTAALVGTGLPSTPASMSWWLDVESANAWLGSVTLNTASINGTIAYLDAQKVKSVGIYANRNDSHTLFTPSSTFRAGTLSWLATGSQTLVGGLSFCNYSGFTRDGMALVQWWPSSPSLDADAPCVGYVSGPLDPVAGTAVSGLTVHLLHKAPAGGVTLTLSSSSAAGRFAVTSAAGPGSPRTLKITFPANATTTAFSYWDTRSGHPSITALGSLGRIANSATVVPAPLSRLSISPTSLTLAVGASHTIVASASDRWGNAVRTPTALQWTVTPSVAATITQGPAARATLRGVAAEPVTVTATLKSLVPGGNPVVAHRTVEILPPPGAGVGAITGLRRVVAGAASGPLHVRTWAPVSGSASEALVVRASSRNGRLALQPTGPWGRTVDVKISPGGILSTPFYSRETIAGTTVLSAVSRASVIRGTETVARAAPVRLRISPATLRLAVGASSRVRAIIQDRFGNTSLVVARWSTPAGRYVRIAGTHTSGPTIHAVRVGSVQVSATFGAVAGRLVITVTR